MCPVSFEQQWNGITNNMLNFAFENFLKWKRKNWKRGKNPTEGKKFIHRFKHKRSSLNINIFINDQNKHRLHCTH